MTTTIERLNTGWDTGITLLDNVVRLDEVGVHVFDRREYPFEQGWVACATSSDVAAAIAGMVTQSSAPAAVASYGMILAAREAAASSRPDESLARLAEELVQTRPTNHNVRRSVHRALEALAGQDSGRWEELAAQAAVESERFRRQRAEQIGHFGAELLHDGARLLTHCWAETGVPQMVREAVASGKHIEAYCAETRPYLQGARLTADALRDAGAQVTVVPDTAVGYLISERMVDLAVTGADRVSDDGGVVNKIGTLAIANNCSRYGVPFYSVCIAVDHAAATPDDVEIEFRNSDEALHCRGHRTAAEGVAGFYPAFDRTPPDLVTGLITPTGIIRPGDAHAYGIGDA